MRFVVYCTSSTEPGAMEGIKAIEDAGFGISKVYEGHAQRVKEKADVHAGKSVVLPRFFVDDVERTTKRNNGGLVWLKAFLANQPKADHPHTPSDQLPKETVVPPPKPRHRGKSASALKAEIRDLKTKLEGAERRNEDLHAEVNAIAIDKGAIQRELDSLRTIRSNEQDAHGKSLHDLRVRLREAGIHRGSVLVVTVGERRAETGRFFEEVAYKDDVDAIAACVRCMEAHGGRALFLEVSRSDLPHVVRSWDSEDHTVWLETLPVR